MEHLGQQHTHAGQSFKRLFRVLDQNRGAEHRPRPGGAPRGAQALISRAGLDGGAVDRVAVRIIEKIFLSRDRPDLEGDVRGRIQQAHDRYASPELLENPSRFFRPAPDPVEMRLKRLGRLRRGERLRLIFRSTYSTHDPDFSTQYRCFEENSLSRNHLWLHSNPGRPTVICVHTWCGGVLPLEERIFNARAIYRLGFNVALFTMPFHGGRTPQQARFGGQLFPSRELQRTNEAFGQAVADLRVLMRWLRQERGSGPLGIIGMSLGGYTTALMAGLEPSLAFAVPIITPCSFADVLWHHGSKSPARKEAEGVGFTLWDFRTIWAVHCPLCHQPRLPRERMLMLWGQGDYVVPAVHQLALWEHLGRPEIHAFAGGHLVHLGRLGYMRALKRFLRRWR